MNKLSKPKAFEASPNSITVMFGNQETECTNLTRSAIMVQTIVLVAHEGKWHEIEIADLGLDTVHLPSFKHHIESNGLKLSDLGIAAEVPVYGLQHPDFLELETLYPKYSYIQISKLYEYLKKYGIPHSKNDIKKTLEMVSAHYADINEYIESVEKRKNEIISRPDVQEYDDPEEAYHSVVDQSKPQHVISVDSIPVPVPEDSVSISIFENLSPGKITELTVLKAEQEKIAKENPVVVITNKTTYATAKKTKAILLSASTKIDGKTGVFANAKKFINTFKTAFDREGDIIAKITREPHDKQNALIVAWEDRAKLQAQNRVKELMSVPFVFNPADDVYTIGTLNVNQKGIEELSDEEFTKIIDQGKAIKIAIDSVKTEQDTRIKALEEQNALLQDQIKNFMLTIQSANAANGVATSVINAISGSSIEAPVIENPFEPVAEIKTPDPTADYSAQTSSYIALTDSAAVFPEKVYLLPHPDNKLLNELDLAHVSVLEEKQYIECREYYAQALQDASDAINDILVNPDKTIQKSVAITELIKTWKL